MQIIVPKVVTGASLVSSNVPETDYTEWSAVTAYTLDVYCILASVHKVYRCLVANTNKQPDLNSSGTDPAWQEVGYTNRWRCLDPYVNTTTSKIDGIVMVVDSSSCDSVALFNLSGTAMTLELLVDSVVVNTQAFSLSSRSVGSWYDYFFNEFLSVSDISTTFPVYYNSQLRITITGAAACGNVVCGRTKYVGKTLYEPTIGILDFSKKVTDANFGNTFLLPGAYSKKASLSVYVENARVDYVFKLLAAQRGIPAVWLCDNGSPKFEVMQIYGFFRDFSIVIPGPTMSKCSIEIEGLI